MTINYKKLLLTTAVAMSFITASEFTTPDSDKPTTTTFSGNFRTETKKGDKTTSTVDVKLSGDYTKSSAETVWKFLLDIITTGNDAVELHVSGKGSHKTDPSELAGSVTFKDGIDIDANVQEAISAAFKGRDDKVTLMDALNLLGMTKITTTSSRSSRVIDMSQDVNGMIQALINSDMPITIREILAQLGLTPVNAKGTKDKTPEPAAAAPMDTSEAEGKKSSRPREEGSDTSEIIREKSRRTEASE